jgi:oligosaccharide reducing-end xylanase
MDRRVISGLGVVLLGACTMCTAQPHSSMAAKKLETTGAFFTGEYDNLFTTLLGKSEEEVNLRVERAFDRLFYGDDSTERVYFPVEPGMAYIEDILHRDVRTEGMSYGMMIAVQMGKKMEFDRLWKWAKTHMQHQGGPYKTFFAWHCTPEGAMIDSGAAPDGEEWFVMALLFASARWGDFHGIFHYRREANAILDAMLNKESAPENNGRVKNMFDRDEHQVVFVPSNGGAAFTDPSYHLPHFYELWSRWAGKENQFWSEAVWASRRLLKRAAHPVTGLAPDYARFDGTPIDPWKGGHADFRFDAWRVAMNVGVDYAWFSGDPWEVTQSNRLLEFFHSEGRYGNQYTLEGVKLAGDHSPGLVAMNAVACLSSTGPYTKDFVEEFWNTPVPAGPYRYYDGLLYMLGLLQVSGKFRIYGPADSAR